MLRYNIYSERGDGEGQIVTEAGPSGHWMRYTDHIEVRDALVQALEGAMRISSLWRITEPVSVEHEEEAKALQAMYNAFSAALALAKNNTNPAP